MVLYIDTSAARGQLALSHDNQLLAHRWWQKDGSHSEKLTVELMEMLGEAQTTLNKLTKIAVVVGPGSFTGLRVGINAGKAIAYSLNIPIVPINSLFALACSDFGKDQDVYALIDAQRNSVFLSCYNSEGKVKLENIITSLSDIVFSPGAFVCGSGWIRYQSFLEPKWQGQVLFHHEWADPAQVIGRLSGLPEKSWQQIQPLYIRKSAAEEKLT